MHGRFRWRATCSPSDMPNDKRRDPRRSVLVECALEGTSGRTEVRLQDLSIGGCSIDTRTPYPLGAPITVTIMLAGTKTVLRGNVVYQSSGTGLGVQFGALKDEVKQRLVAFLGEAQAS